MSRCSKKCNEIKEMIDSISGLDDDYVYGWLKSLESVTCSIVGFIDTYADRNELNGTCFKDNNIDIEEIETYSEDGIELYDKHSIHFNRKKINELVRKYNKLNREIKELKEK